MRLHINIKGSGKLIPFQHQKLLAGTVYKWLGKTDQHGEVSMYSFSRLDKLEKTDHGLMVKHYSTMFFSSHNPDLIKQLIRGIQSDNSMFNGLKVVDLVVENDPDLNHRTLFQIGSPIFIKRKSVDGNSIDFIYYTNSDAGALLEATLITKMKRAGIDPDPSLSIQFDKEAPFASVKKVDYGTIANKASWCPLIIHGTHQTKLFAWNVGLGNSTGIGFGAIK
jgi:CRISPR-associated endoribonuclease Cas6